MPGVARVNQDAAGGTIVGNLAPTVFVDNKPIAVLNAAVAGHGDAPHSSPVMAEASPNVYANNIPVCRQGDAATCGHTASGSGDVFAN